MTKFLQHQSVKLGIKTRKISLHTNHYSL